jgi:hypothetical protein
MFCTKPVLADDDPKYSVPGHPLLVVILIPFTISASEVGDH